ncbi:MAG TPA: hypothetical protein PKA76_19100 [Pirellulaceae bacterium]|nr:hypothetical protein [Pirellulaceae bacterium]
MKPAFANLAIDFWVHRGKLGDAQLSLCLFHDSKDIGSPIIDALNELKNEISPAQRKLTFVKCSRERALSTLRLVVVPGREDLQVMSIRCDPDGATIEMTDEGLKLLIDACTAWLGGAEDFGVSPRHSSMKPKDFGKLDRESGELWFWGPGYAGP